MKIIQSHLDVVEVVLHEGDLQGVGHARDVVEGGCGDGAEDARHARLDHITQGLARLEAVVCRELAHISGDQGLGQDGSVVIDGGHCSLEG